ncbi:unnamed protein product [Wuchereria bancrofti]|uniref:Phospholipase A2-like central domain-containing protein n=1 Tax=Wuchereria bancrofti TaxID=6293 RepID=A0A3P7EWR7_WUCBA|nr:unnamed protein product [Wuchereria bancrofti]
MQLVKSMHLESLTLIICLFYASIALMDAKLKALWNLDKMSVCRLGYPATVYNNYGCWCGVGGSGKPMDGIDRLHFAALLIIQFHCMCCMNHDLCYDKAVRDDDCYDTAEEYLLPYNWKCIQGQSICLNYGNFRCCIVAKVAKILVSLVIFEEVAANSKCASAICACDSEVVKCWSRFEKPKIHAKCTKMNINKYHYRQPLFDFFSLLRSENEIL